MAKGIKEMKGFDLSKDYKELWRLINEGYRVPAWVLHTEEYKEPIYNLVEVKINRLGNHSIGSIGIGYSGSENNYDGFLVCCKTFYLEFILPKEK